MVVVKICGITNLKDALAAVSAGADALGFNFYKQSPRYIAPSAALKIIEQLPDSVMSVGVFVNAGGPDEVARVADQIGLKAVQLHGDESPAYCRALKGRFVIKALRVAEGFEPSRVKEFETDAILLDAYSRRARGGTGRVVDWDVAREVRELHPKLFLAGGLSAENVADAVTAVRPFAVDACSSLESEPGKKDFGRVRAFIETVRAVAPVKP